MTFKYKSRLWVERKSEVFRDFFETKWVKGRLRLVFLIATYRAAPGTFWLFVRARFGSVAAYDRLLCELLPGMTKLAYLMLGNAQLAQKAVVLVADRLFSNLRSFHFDRPIFIFFFRGLIKECLENQALLEAKVTLLENKQWPEDVRFLEQLSTDQRLVLILFELCGLKDSEVAKVLDITRGTVRSRLHAARFHLKPLIPNADTVLR